MSVIHEQVNGNSCMNTFSALRGLTSIYPACCAQLAECMAPSTSGHDNQHGAKRTHYLIIMTIHLLIVIHVPSAKEKSRTKCVKRESTTANRDRFSVPVCQILLQSVVQFHLSKLMFNILLVTRNSV